MYIGDYVEFRYGINLVKSYILFTTNYIGKYNNSTYNGIDLSTNRLKLNFFSEYDYFQKIIC